jgi:formylglycine-generating enzyme required for sulfatase activity
LNERERGGGYLYRLPTEAEWEYACRGGATSEADCSFHFYFDKPTNDLSAGLANFDCRSPFGNAPKEPDKYLGRPTMVDDPAYPPNRLGLRHMHGNVWHYCADLAKEGGSLRELRGGSFDYSGYYCRAVGRVRVRSEPSGGDRNTGFRLARVPVSGEKDETTREEPKKDEKKGPLGMTFVRIPRGTFYMGWDGPDRPGKLTPIKEDFEIAVHTVTQEQWAALMDGADRYPSQFRPAGRHARDVEKVSDADLKRFPVENVSWDMVQVYIQKLNERERGGGYLYRLPTEAEWEYACRGGATSEADCSFHFYFDKPTNELSAKWVNFNGVYPFANAPKEPDKYLGRPTMVDDPAYPPNRLGLTHMHGNIWQWSADLAREGRPFRVIRGGGWASTGSDCRAASRSDALPSDRGNSLGFRLARVPVQ